MTRRIPLILLCLAAAAQRCLALGQTQYVEAEHMPGSFPIVENGKPASLFVEPGDFRGVIRAANDLRSDISEVTGRTPLMAQDGKSPGTNMIIIGTIGRSETIDRLAREGRVDTSYLAGKWESFLIQVVPRPLPGVDTALIICGSDKRGTIYGIYDVSEEIGVSPWHFWADVPVRHRDELFVKAGAFGQGPPAVKYRGIFLNDEAPDLTGWANERFGGYNHAFYTNVYELLLRLKANYLWPAMWNNCFDEDDPINAKLADEYGIVMGTSHVEPMMRADKEWNRAGHLARDWNFQTHSNELSEFWRQGIERDKNYENITTIAMRGKIDTPMSETANIALLEEIVTAQRKIIGDVYRTNVEAVPQLWALYKEVQEYYEKGMRVPDDVTLLWCDDNWGNIRRLPTPEERRRKGGAGIYYHFDYVGDPRNYKWINTVQIERVWEQMNLALNYGADRIWIANVGHLQHVAFPTEFFLALAWDPVRWPVGSIPEFARLWAEREFGAEFAPQIADVMLKSGKYNARRKPELLEPGTFSLVNYREADTVWNDWEAIASKADGISRKLSNSERDAFFELVLYPAEASMILNEIYIATAINRLYAAQGRATANEWGAYVNSVFQEDGKLSAYYNRELAGGKWNHMMDQTHIGYTYWQQPESNRMPRVVELALPEEAGLGVAVEGSTNWWPGSPENAALPRFEQFGTAQHYMDIFNRGKGTLQFSAAAGEPWIMPNATNGTIVDEKRIWLNVDWRRAPGGLSHGSMTIKSGTNSVTVAVDAFNPPAPRMGVGFLESGGCVAVEAEHFTRKVDTASAHWEIVSGVGRTLSAMTVFPVTAESVNPPVNSPCLEYKMDFFEAGKVRVEAVLSPTLNFVPGRGLRFATSFDDTPPRIATAVPENYSAGGGNRDWEKTVADSGRKVAMDFELTRPGEHTLKIWMVDPGIVLQRIVVDCGGVKPSYLGPPESSRR